MNQQILFAAVSLGVTGVFLFLRSMILNGGGVRAYSLKLDPSSGDLNSGGRLDCKPPSPPSFSTTRRKINSFSGQSTERWRTPKRMKFEPMTTVESGTVLRDGTCHFDFDLN